MKKGDQVYIREGKQNIPGVIMGPTSTPRSYLVLKKGVGGFWKRNRRFLIKPKQQPVLAQDIFQETDNYT